MTLQNMKDQQVQLLAKKALLQDELKSVEVGLGQVSAVIQFTEAAEKAAADQAAADAAKAAPTTE